VFLSFRVLSEEGVTGEVVLESVSIQVVVVDEGFAGGGAVFAELICVKERVEHVPKDYNHARDGNSVGHGTEATDEHQQLVESRGVAELRK